MLVNWSYEIDKLQAILFVRSKMNKKKELQISLMVKNRPFSCDHH